MRTLRGTVRLLVGSLVVLVVASAVATGVGRMTVAAAQRELDQQVLPARQTATDLATAYVDQETGQRGYLLTGDEEFLEPYERGRAAAQELQRRLPGLLGDDGTSADLVAAVRAAADAWHDATAAPGIAARRQQALSAEELAAATREGKVRFDALRAELSALEQHTAERTAEQLRAIGRAQAVANVVGIAAAVLALAVAVGAVPLVRRLLTRPLDRLLEDLQAVAAGDQERTISSGGSRELASIAAAVDRMRAGVLAHSRERAVAQQELAIRQEHDRMAADLHDLTIQRVFGVGLRLSALARRRPEVADAVRPLVQQTDRIIRELRTVIFNLSRSESSDTLRGRVIDLADESARVLGFPPALEFSGAVDTLVPEAIGAEVLAALREALSNTARHAAPTAVDISLETGDGRLTLTVSDDGVGLPPGAAPGNGLANLRARAERLGGTVDVCPRPDGTGTTVRWRVPVGPP